jgi:hypothetical protein
MMTVKRLVVGLLLTLMMGVEVQAQSVYGDRFVLKSVITVPETIRSGNGVPGGGVGNNGDKYVDTATSIWYTKSAGTWYAEVLGSTSSFTSGSVLFADSLGHIGQDNANFFWDVGNHRLGIGTVAPAVFLEVLGTTEQLRLSRDATHFTSFTVDALGSLNLAPNKHLTFTTTGTAVTTFQSGVTTGATTSAAVQIALNALSSGTGLYLNTGNTFTTGKIIDVDVNGTGAGASQTGLNISLTGANGTAGITSYGGQISNTHSTNTSTNVALYLNASGAATANYGLIVNAGSVGIGKTNPGTILDVNGTGTFTTVNSTAYQVSGNALATTHLADVTAPTDVAFSAGNFTGGGTQTWTLTSGDQATFAYAIVGKIMTVWFDFATTSVGGGANPDLKVTIPASKSAAKAVVVGGIFYSDNGGANAQGIMYTTASGTTLNFEKNDTSNWTAAANTTRITGTVTIPIS